MKHFLTKDYYANRVWMKNVMYIATTSAILLSILIMKSNAGIGIQIMPINVSTLNKLIIWSEYYIENESTASITI